MAEVICVDFGSTFTKASLVDLADGRIIAAADHPTTIALPGRQGDVLDGFTACRSDLTRQHPRAAGAEVLACSSAGGGLRIGVLGNEELVTAEAGRRVALSSGGKVVHVAWGPLDGPGLGALVAAGADVLLLTGGTDGGNEDVLLHNAATLEGEYWPLPVVVAGNVEVRDRVAFHLVEGGTPHVLTDNVLPRIGVLAPDGARAAIREMFLEHVIGGKHLSASDDFRQMVRGATPDVVLTGVELLARGLDEDHPGAGDVAVVDVGGATTDVHSVVALDSEGSPEPGGLSREVVAVTPVTRTVEGDLGMRWSALSTVEAAGLSELAAPASIRRDRPGYLPEDDREADIDEQIARAAVDLALRRHAGRSRVVVSPEGRVLERTGKDLREIDLLIGSGGVLRNGRPGVVDRVLADSLGPDHEGGWQLPRAPRVVVDHDYALCAIGLLAGPEPEAAYRLAQRLSGAAAGSE